MTVQTTPFPATSSTSLPGGHGHATAPAGSYEKLLNKVTALELDLGATVGANNRLVDDIDNLRVVHEDMVDAYTRLKSQSSQTKRALQAEREARSAQEQVRITHSSYLHSLIFSSSTFIK